ncbi:hypothetical protein EOJ36_06675 [Sandaracinomonas limnophila]|uniref:Aminotransferase class I/classII large domain-containing protein n=1 Tax=Sandaracinomonas limnophila TaxID=1862386 RepID=A0A437PQZ9_9BACT|nr:aminotransferase class I/II-fold pyridoxal phosphate-dependent enzyme [Sandaracinomonas limnophila]RVU24692.1 hypothetical protein EOJ36_06675 [Sandaracinomonas limnophila]
MANYNLFLDDLPQKYIKMDGVSYKWIGGSNYLCIGSHPQFQQNLKIGIHKFPQNWGSSRSNNVKFELWDEFEGLLAEKFQHENAALCTSGQLAGQTCLSVLSQIIPEFEVKVAPNTHPALWPHHYYPTYLTKEEWINSLRGIKHSIIVSDGIQSPLMQELNFDWAKDLDASNILIVDESHRLGLIPISIDTPATLIQTASLSKTFGIPAGIIFSNSHIIHAIKSHPFWIGSSPANPSYIYAALNSQDAYLEQKNKLDQLVKKFQNQVLPGPLIVQNHPSFAFKTPEIFDKFKENGFLLNQFPYPQPTDEPITRGLIHPLLNEIDVEEIIKIMNYEI